LIKLTQRKFPLTEQEILEHVLRLQEREKIRLKTPKKVTADTFTSYVRSSQAYWYWAILILASTTTLLVFTVPENAFPIVYMRYILGSIFVLWLPGYTFIRALFPKREIDNIERIALSVGMSLALVPLVGLLLNYTPWGIRITPVTMSLLALTISFATAAVIREHQTKLQGTR